MTEDILFEDEHLLIMVKPADVLSEPSDDTAFGTIHPITRLDRQTEGLILYAKTADAAARLSHLIRSGAIEKTYLAAVEGIPDREQGELSDLLFYDRRRGKSYVVDRERKGVRRASLSYELIDSTSIAGQPVSLLRIRLHTGRTHQIRVQMGARGMPVVGDRRYGSRVRSSKLLLCSHRLTFRHPYTHEHIDIRYIPEDEPLFELGDPR